MTKKFRNAVRLALLLLGATVIFVALLSLYACARMGGLPEPQEYNQKYAAMPNFKDGKFVNTEPAAVDMSRGGKPNMLRFLFEGNDVPEIPMQRLSPSDFAAVPDRQLSIRWLGHSMLMVEMDETRFLTDPVFGNAAPIPFAVRRYTPAPIAREELPPLDFVIISHDHYDHLEYDTVRYFRDRTEPFIVPLGVGERLKSWGIQPGRIHELNWGQSVTIKNLTVTATEARHFSGRSFSDRDRTLWASFAITGSQRFFFGADGGYGKHFKQIGNDFGSFDAAALEIDAWNIRWPNNHLFPDEVILATGDLNAKILLPIHWSVFNLAMHPYDESINKVKELAQTHKIPLRTPQIGEKVIIKAETNNVQAR